MKDREILPVLETGGKAWGFWYPAEYSYQKLKKNRINYRRVERQSIVNAIFDCNARKSFSSQRKLEKIYDELLKVERKEEKYMSAFYVESDVYKKEIEPLMVA